MAHTVVSSIPFTRDVRRARNGMIHALLDAAERYDAAGDHRLAAEFRASASEILAETVADHPPAA